MKVLIAALAHFVVVFLSGAVPLKWAFEGDFFDFFLAFGAGVLLSAAFLHMMPEAIEHIGPATGIFMLAGYVLMTVLERFTMAHPCAEDDHCPNHRIGVIAFLGLSIHSVLAGMALGVGLVGTTNTSVMLALLAAILVHKVPETLALMALLASAHWSKQKSFLMLMCFSAMGPGGILAGAFLNFGSPRFMGIALAFSAGTFLFIASGDLLPHLHRKMKQKWVNFLAFLLGLFALSFEAWPHLFG